MYDDVAEVEVLAKPYGTLRTSYPHGCVINFYLSYLGDDGVGLNGADPFINVIFRSPWLRLAISLVNVAAVMFRVSTPSRPTMRSPGSTNPSSCELGFNEWIMGPSGVVSIMVPNGPDGAYT